MLQTINTMIDYVNEGNRLFYDIYSEADKQADARKNNTGLFFCRGEPGRPFAIICPGGGFSYVGAIHEGFPLAIALSKMDYNAFSIQYRTGGAQVACEDLAQAIDFICATASDWESELLPKAGKRMPSGFGRNTFPVKIELLTENIVKGRNRLRSTFAMLFVEQ